MLAAVVRPPPAAFALLAAVVRPPPAALALLAAVVRPPPAAFALLAATLACACGPGPPQASVPRGLFLIVVDTLRADRLSCYGYEAHRTPHADALAQAGVRFARAHAVASWTVPSMGALLTSRLPAELGLIERRDDPKWPGRKRQRRRQRSLSLPPEPETLAGALRAAGFHTAAFVDQPMLSPRHGFHRGFDDWYQPDARGVIRRHDPAQRSRQTWATSGQAYESDTRLVEAFEAWLGANAQGERPLFAWLHLLTPHRPYDPPSQQAPVAAEPAPADLYDAEVRAVDALLGRVLSAIEIRIGRQNAAVVLTSDHGEAFGEHGIFEHGNTLHREVQDVPLLLSAPSRLPAGVTIDASVATLDVAPTLLELAGVPIPASLRGASLLSLLDEPGAGRTVFAEGVLYGASQRTFIDAGYKLLLDEATGKASLYAIGRDPEERSDLAAEQPQRAAALRARMEALRRDLRPPDAEPVEPSAASADALRALGYLDEDESAP